MTTRSGKSGKKTNKALKEQYEEIYARGEEQYFSKFDGGIDRSETNRQVLSLTDWQGRSVVDVGCGTGELLRQIAERGARGLTGIDYSEKAIEIARSRGPTTNTRYVSGDFLDMTPVENDVVISCGTIEHSDNPGEFLKALERWCRDDGMIIVTCPHFINVRGFVWMALATLQEVPMSLTDLHFIHPWQMEAWCSSLGLRIREFSSCDHDRANGDMLVEDFAKRLRNALRDAGMDNSRVPGYLDYLKNLVAYLQQQDASGLQGATAIYVMEKAG